MIVTSGLRCLELSESAGRLGCLQRMLLGTSRWVSTRCWLTWKAKATPAGHLLFQLVPKTHHIEETESGLWRTPMAADGTHNHCLAPSVLEGRTTLTLTNQVKGCAQGLWPTPRASDHIGGPVNPERVSQNSQGWTTTRKKTGARYGATLPDVVNKMQKMWPTPTAQDAKNNGGPSQMERNSLPLNAEAGGSLNPTFVEWLMGYPTGWTDCEDLETPLSRKSPMKSSGQ